MTPMMQQYADAKLACGDALLLFRVGDFYELFHDDARLAARTLGLTLTTRRNGECPIAMAGFPYHQLDAYIAKLTATGHQVAVYQPVVEPRKMTTPVWLLIERSSRADSGCAARTGF